MNSSDTRAKKGKRNAMERSRMRIEFSANTGNCIMHKTGKKNPPTFPAISDLACQCESDLSADDLVSP